MQIAFIGLGRMGAPMACRLVEAGHDLAVHDTRREAAQSHVELGARFAQTAAEAAAGAELVFTSLPGPAEVESTVLGAGGIADACRPGTVYADLSSNSPAVVRRIHDAMARRDCPVLDAPVSGGVGGAQNGTLQIMVGGSRDVYERVLPVLRVLGAKVSLMGGIGCGTVAKLAHNLAYIATRSVLAECFTLGVKGGVDPEALLEAMRGGAFGQGLLLSHYMPEMVLKGSFEPVRFAMKLAYKDVTLATGLARELQLPMAMGALTEQLLAEAMARGWGDKDYGAAFLLQEERAGVRVRARGATADGG